MGAQLTQHMALCLMLMVRSLVEVHLPLQLEAAAEERKRQGADEGGVKHVDLCGGCRSLVCPRSLTTHDEAFIIYGYSTDVWKENALAYLGRHDLLVVKQEHVCFFFGRECLYRPT